MNIAHLLIKSAQAFPDHVALAKGDAAHGASLTMR